MRLGKEYKAVESVPSAWPTLVIPACGLYLETPRHTAVPTCLLGEDPWAGMGHPCQREKALHVVSGCRRGGWGLGAGLLGKGHPPCPCQGWAHCWGSHPSTKRRCFPL